MGAGVLFDVDGTLVDTTYLNTVCWWQALREHNHEVPTARIHRAIGMGADHLLDHLLGTDRDRNGDGALIGAHAALYAVYWPWLRPTPGAAALVRACHERGLTVVLASSARGDELAALRGALDADAAIDAVTTADDVASSKPDADIIEVALRRGAMDRDDAVLVGDSVWDVQAAARAGVPCVGLECGGTSAAELRDVGAVAVYRDPQALLQNLNGSVIGALAAAHGWRGGLVS